MTPQPAIEYAAEAIDRIAPTHRPAEPAVGYHRWTELLFVHWRVRADELAPLLPPQLTVDTFDGSAWVGLVPFHMSGVRPRWSPAVPGVSRFHETNVRTYVHFEGQDPGVWFFSLDASSSLAVRVARWRWHLNYFRAQMNLQREPAGVRYSSRRLWPGSSGAGCSITANIGGPFQATLPGASPGQAIPGTLEHFLVERYVLYAQRKNGGLLQGRVHHRAYPLREAALREFEETLLAACGIARPVTPEHVIFSPGVDVEIFKLKPID